MHQVYKTTDIVLAAFLKVSGHALMSIEKQGQKGIFAFSLIPEALLSAYDLGQTVVEPITFNNTIKQLTTSVRRML